MGIEGRSEEAYRGVKGEDIMGVGLRF